MDAEKAIAALREAGLEPGAWEWDRDEPVSGERQLIVESARLVRESSLALSRALFETYTSSAPYNPWRITFVAPGSIAARGAPRPERRVYISGPMRGYPDNNYPLFHRVVAEQRALGYEVCSPAEYDDGTKPFVLREAMAFFCNYICNEATHILMLPGWQASMGATTEYNLARNCNLVVEYYSADAVAVTVSDLHAVVPARSVQAYLATYLTGWEAGGCEQRPTINVRPNPNGGYTVDAHRPVVNEYEIRITHTETSDEVARRVVDSSNSGGVDGV